MAASARAHLRRSTPTASTSTSYGSSSPVSEAAGWVGCGCARRVSAAEDVAKVLHGPSPVEQCRGVPVLGAEVLNQGHIVVEGEHPDQGEQVRPLACDGGDLGDRPGVESHDLWAL